MRPNQFLGKIDAFLAVSNYHEIALFVDEYILGLEYGFQHQLHLLCISMCEKEIAYDQILIFTHLLGRLRVNEQCLGAHNFLGKLLSDQQALNGLRNGDVAHENRYLRIAAHVAIKNEIHAGGGPYGLEHRLQIHLAEF